MADEIKHLSVSKIKGFMMCPLSAKFRYKDRIPEASAGVMLGGRVVHAILERALKRILLGGPLMTAAEMDDLYDPTWEELHKKEEEREEFIGWKWDDDDPEATVHKECRALVRLARTEVLPAIKPKFVEHGINFDLPSDAGQFRIYGYIDLLEESGMMDDWKTVRGKVSANARKLDVQFPGYSCWLVENGGAPVTQCRKIFLIRGKNPKVDFENYSITEDHRRWFRFVAAQVWKTVKADAYIPNCGGWWCSEKFCSFYDTCQGEL